MSELTEPQWPKWENCNEPKEQKRGGVAGTRRARAETSAGGGKRRASCWDSGGGTGSRADRTRLERTGVILSPTGGAGRKAVAWSKICALSWLTLDPGWMNHSGWRLRTLWYDIWRLDDREQKWRDSGTSWQEAQFPDTAWKGRMAERRNEQTGDTPWVQGRWCLLGCLRRGAGRDQQGWREGRGSALAWATVLHHGGTVWGHGNPWAKLVWDQEGPAWDSWEVASDGRGNCKPGCTVAMGTDGGVAAGEAGRGLAVKADWEGVEKRRGSKQVEIVLRSSALTRARVTTSICIYFINVYIYSWEKLTRCLGNDIPCYTCCFWPNN